MFVFLEIAAIASYPLRLMEVARQDGFDFKQETDLRVGFTFSGPQTKTPWTANKGCFWTTLAANKTPLRTTLTDNRPTLSANSPQTSGQDHIK